MGRQPSGTVTLLFTDIEGSTRLLEQLGAERYTEVLAEHRRVLREAFAQYDGYEVDNEGDAFFVAFEDASAGVASAREAQAALDGGPIRVRMGLHTGRPFLDPPKYVGIDVHLAARVMSAGHGGQVLLTRETRELVNAEVVDLGDHRLKDFSEPVSLYQLGEAPFPPLKTISNTNLPRPASSFVGREREVAEVVSLIREGARLVTLTGSGGSGKTRLAIDVAAELVPEFRAGVFWVGLAPLRDAASVVPSAAGALGAGDDLAAHIGERELMLLLDNLEQVIDAAPDLAGLVESCPNLVLLATSRELLRVRGEVEYAVLPLADPDAVKLFTTRAQVASGATVEELCRRLDNMPLALELAAARAQVLTPEQILERLSQRLDLFRGGRDADPRQQTLRATIEWSYDLLDAGEQALFARLAVFAGGCTLDAAQDVAHADLDSLQSLVDKSLLRRTDDRLWMLETIHEYASERLAESGGGESIRHRHVEYFLAEAEAARPQLLASGQRDLVQRLADDLDNFRQAISDSLVSAPETALAIVSALEDFWLIRGHLAEARRWIEDGLARGAAEPSALRARALGTAAWVALRQGDRVGLTRFAGEGLALARKFGETESILSCLVASGMAVEWVGEFERAEHLYREVADLARAKGDEKWLAWAVAALGSLELTRGNFADALEHSEQALQMFRALGDDWSAAIALVNSGHASLHLVRHDEAAQKFRAALVLGAQVGNPETVGVALGGLAAVEAQPERAACLLGAAGRLLELAGAELPPAERRLQEQTSVLLRGRMDDDEFGRAWDGGRSMALDEAVEYGLASVD